VSSATNLASLIVQGYSERRFLLQRVQCAGYGNQPKKYGESYFYDKFVSKTQNVGSNLQHIVVLLVSSRSIGE
jgi:carboxyl-terminal processing protease